MTEVVVRTAGGCMRPWIWPNGLLHVEPCKVGDLQLGDIAVWFDGKDLISHRVVEVGTDVLATRADSSATLDAPVQRSQLLGRAVRFTKGAVSYRLDGPLMRILSRVGRKPWSKLMSIARWSRNRLKHHQ